MKTGFRQTLNFKQRLMVWFVAIFAVFTIGVVVLEQSRERQQKTVALEGELDIYADIADAALHGGDPHGVLDSVMALFPGNLRLTLVSDKGKVLYDNPVNAVDNHASRPEIEQARAKGTGTSIRLSASNNHEYIYYAKRFGDHYLRVALPYDVGVRNVLKPDKLFLYYTAVLFAAILLLVNYVAGRFGKSIGQLHSFALATEDEDTNLPATKFPDDELGEIGAKIASHYRQLTESKKAIAREREKLLQHVHSSEEGICFFSPGRKVEFCNGLFIQYLNIISDRLPGDPEAALSEPAFENIIPRKCDGGGNDDAGYREIKVARHGKHFAVRVNSFEDGGFEIIVNDITSQEKTRLLKQEMTGNIAHELRTPVTTIRGDLETVLEQPLDTSRQHQFISKAYGQTVVLSELIRDMSLITKIEEAPQAFTLEMVGIRGLLDGLFADLEPQLRANNIEVQCRVGNNVTVKGNRHLLYSIFRNLTDNAIRYAGSGVTISVGVYNEDSEFYYFSFSDTGTGIPDEKHLGRIFERFYRVGEGRTRDTGGSGLGLSIVRNAVAFHRGTITAKNAPSGGLEFLFKLPKK